tara:strand:+ start:43 stop:186 length:144 start_codon:yes stop_codon:yes gene_type:complete
MKAVHSLTLFEVARFAVKKQNLINTSVPRLCEPCFFGVVTSGALEEN